MNNKGKNQQKARMPYGPGLEWKTMVRIKVCFETEWEKGDTDSMRVACLEAVCQ